MMTPEEAQRILDDEDAEILMTIHSGDMVRTIAGMAAEYAVQIESPRDGWILTGSAWQHSREGAEEELRNPIVIPPGWNARLVRRFVTETEAVDGE